MLDLTLTSEVARKARLAGVLYLVTILAETAFCIRLLFKEIQSNVEEVTMVVSRNVRIECAAVYLGWSERSDQAEQNERRQDVSRCSDSSDVLADGNPR